MAKGRSVSLPQIAKRSNPKKKERRKTIEVENMKEDKKKPRSPFHSKSKSNIEESLPNIKCGKYEEKYMGSLNKIK